MSGTFMDKSFSVAVGGDQAYRDNHDRIFGKKKQAGDSPWCLDEGCPHAAVSHYPAWHARLDAEASASAATPDP